MTTRVVGENTFDFEQKDSYTVKLNGEYVGDITNFGVNYWYHPKGSQRPGEVFTDLESCIRSITGEDEGG